jgi:glyoxylase-like metal-dependent hydrolase (beta-lactamase superfamily II)
MPAVFRPLLVALCWTCVPAICQAEVQPPTPPAGKVDYRVQQLRPDLVLLAGPTANVAVWTGASGTVLVDAGPANLAPQLQEAIARVAREPVRFVIDTHWHADHTGGNEALAKAGAVVVAHESTREHMSQPQYDDELGSKVPAAPAAALPTVTFADSMAIQLDGERMGLVHVASAHTDSDIIVRWQEADAVFLGDLFFNGSYPLVDLASGGSLAGTVAALEGVLARIDAQTIVIPGHGPVATRADLAAYRDMLVAIGRKVREQIEAGSSLDEVLALKLTTEFDERYGKGAVSPERFIRTLFRDLSKPRSAR